LRLLLLFQVPINFKRETGTPTEILSIWRWICHLSHHTRTALCGKPWSKLLETHNYHRESCTEAEHQVEYLYISTVPKDVFVTCHCTDFAVSAYSGWQTKIFRADALQLFSICLQKLIKKLHYFQRFTTSQDRRTTVFYW
jgi:hypothetical protein